MKKLRKSVLASLAIVGASAIVVATSYRPHADRRSNLVLKNVEALTRGEGNTNLPIKCYTSLVYERGSEVVLCSTCKSVKNKTDAWYNLADHCTPSY